MIVTDKKILRQISKEWKNDSPTAVEELNRMVDEMAKAMKDHEGV